MRGARICVQHQRSDLHCTRVCSRQKAVPRWLFLDLPVSSARRNRHLLMGKLVEASLFVKKIGLVYSPKKTGEPARSSTVLRNAVVRNIWLLRVRVPRIPSLYLTHDDRP